MRLAKFVLIKMGKRDFNTKSDNGQGYRQVLLHIIQYTLKKGYGPRFREESKKQFCQLSVVYSRRPRPLSTQKIKTKISFSQKIRYIRHFKTYKQFSQ